MRRFLLLATATSLLCSAEGRFDMASVDAVLRSAVGPKGVPGVVAMVATPDRVLYQGAFGEARTGQPMTLESIFRLYSMTKAVTSTAVMQLVEKGQVDLDAPVERYLPELAKLQILRGFDGAGRPVLTPAARQPTVRQLLAHTAGYGYAIWDETLKKYPNNEGILKAPLLFEPGTKWQYGTNTDVAGRIVEKLSGLSLEAYFQQRIFGPLGIAELTYMPPEPTHGRIVARGLRQPDSSYRLEVAPVPKKITPSGGGGLFGTAADYLKFLQMFLRGGQGVLEARSIAAMRENQIGRLNVRRMMTTDAAFSLDFGFHIEANDKFGLGFQINPTPYEGGRAAHSMAWAGALNTFFWVDPQNRLCAVILMQTLPFFDKPAIRALQDFEKAVYSARR